MNKLLIISLLTLLNSIRSEKFINYDTDCKIIKVDNSKNPLKKHLQRHLEVKTIRDFVNDSSELSILSIIDQDTVVSSYNGHKWFNAKKKFSDRESKKILSKVLEFSNSNSIYTIECPSNFAVFDGLVTQFIWIKRRKEIAFIFYSTGYDPASLKEPIVK